MRTNPPHFIASLMVSKRETYKPRVTPKGHVIALPSFSTKCSIGQDKNDRSSRSVIVPSAEVANLTQVTARPGVKEQAHWELITHKMDYERLFSRRCYGLTCTKRSFTCEN